jgi:energy-coupling factor transport system substrate-specific component
MKSRFVLVPTTLLGALLILWPLFASSQAIAQWQDIGAPILAAIVVPAMLALAINDIVTTSFNTKRIAVVAILTAVAIAVRPLGAGVAGIEPVWIVIIIAGYALGSADGFVIGSAAIATSSLITGSVGPWLPYQMVLAAWIGLFAGLLPKLKSPFDVVILSGYSAVATFIFGWLMNLWFWPTASGLNPDIAFDPTQSPLERIHAWANFSLVTSVGFDVPRCLFTVIGVALAAKPLLHVIQRANRFTLINP